MDKELDAMLNAAAPTWGPRPGGQADGLRRLAADYAAFRAGTYRQPGWWAAKSNSGTKLNSLSRWVINQPGSASRIAELADPEPKPGGSSGALVFGCLLLLTGHPVSAEFWWKYAAGDGDRTAAYCLYLRNLHHGELAEAQVWFEQATLGRDGADNGEGQAIAPSHPDVEDYYTLLSLFTRNAEAYGSTAARPSADLLVAVERLVPARTGSGEENCAGDGEENCADRAIARLPDQDLVDTLSAFTSRDRS